MAQIFKPSADVWLRAAALVVFLAIVFGGVFGTGLARSSYATRQGWPIDQTVPFSHKHHAGDLGIDCRYCHVDVERGPVAGIPPTYTCMTCHSQLWTGAPMLAPVRDSLASGQPLVWTRVAKLPQYVYFDHQIHIARGVPCVECHGRMDEMPLAYRAHALEMRFCLDCHRDPAPHLRPPDQVTRMDWSDWDKVPAHRSYGQAAMKADHIQPAKLTDCGLCHR
ncbi:MAG TPA: cytochrome c3 family protein [Caulobacteraceae bacterium]|nr:cytochrome c3 family protein [Caulobacteraceae bacterium]